MSCLQLKALQRISEVLAEARTCTYAHCFSSQLREQLEKQENAQIAYRIKEQMDKIAAFVSHAEDWVTAIADDLKQGSAP